MYRCNCNISDFPVTLPLRLGTHKTWTPNMDPLMDPNLDPLAKRLISVSTDNLFRK